MKRGWVWGGLVAVSLATAAWLALANWGSTEIQFGRLLVRDGQLNTDQAGAGWWGRLWRPVRVWRIDALYRRFLRAHPAHARAMVAYGCFLSDQYRENEAVRWWQQAIAVDPQLAVAYNNLGEQYAHSGRAADGLRYLQKACDLAPTIAVFHYNWAMVCSLFRREAREVYGWDVPESLRRSLAEFRRARDLAPRDCAFGSAYAEAFYFLPQPDWEELGAAWRFCLEQPVSSRERQLIYGRLARVAMHLRRFDEARSWLARMDGDQVASWRQALLRKLAALESGPAEPAQFMGVRSEPATLPPR